MTTIDSLRDASQNIATTLSGDNNTGKTLRLRGLGGAFAACALSLLYYTTGQFMGGVNSKYLPDRDIPAGSTHTLQTMADLINRELDTGWAPSALVSPVRVRIDMDAFQRGEHLVMKRLSQYIPHMFRVGAESKEGLMLMQAGDHINRRSDTWSVWDQNDTPTNLRNGAKLYNQFNVKLSKGEIPPFVPRIDLLESIVTELKSILSVEHTRIEQVVNSDNLIWGAREPFYHAQGVMYATSEALRALYQDFYPVLDRQSSLETMEAAIRAAVGSMGKKPLPVLNDDGFGFFGGNVQALDGVISQTLVQIEALRDGLAAGVSRGPSTDAHVTPNPAKAALQHLKK